MLSNVLHSVLLINDEVLHSTSSLLMDLLKPLDRYNKHLHFMNDSASSKYFSAILASLLKSYCHIFLCLKFCCSRFFDAAENSQLMSDFLFLQNYVDTGVDSMLTSPFMDYESWTWIIDCEQVCSLLLGRCIYKRIVGDVDYSDINRWKSWLQSDLFHEALACKINSSAASPTSSIGLLKIFITFCCYNDLIIIVAVLSILFVYF